MNLLFKNQEMTSYATMRQLQKEGGKLLKKLSPEDNLILTIHGKPYAEVKLKISIAKKKFNQSKALKYAGAYTGLKHDLKTLDHEWE